MIITNENITDINDDLITELRLFIKEIYVTKERINPVIIFGQIGKLEIVKSFLKENLCKRILLRNNQSIVGLSIMGGIYSGLVKDVLVLNTLTHTVSIIYGNEIIKIVEKDTLIPTKKSMIFTTSKDNQTSMKIDIIEEHGIDHIPLGTIELDGIHPSRRGVAQIEMTVDVESSLSIRVILKDLGTGKSNSIVLDGSKDLDKEANKIKRKWFRI